MGKRIAVTLTLIAYGFIYPEVTGVKADFEPELLKASVVNSQSTTALASAPLPRIPSQHKTAKVWVTAYSSTPDQTDDTPFITASGKSVRDGILATNMLPMGTRVKIPKYFGNKVFVVEDRMHPRKVNYVDVWMETREDALRFGHNRADIVIMD